MLSVKDLEVAYYAQSSRQEQFLKNVSIELETNQVLGIISRNQSSKQPLINCLLNNDKPSSGSVSVDRHNLSMLHGAALRSSKALVGYAGAVNDLLPSKTVYENIVLPLQFSGIGNREAHRYVEPLLEYFKLRDIMRKKASSLNNYEIARVKLARAMVNNPKILVIDEITSGLDIKSAQNIISKLRHLRRNYDKAIVIFSNDVDVIKTLCDEVAILHNDQLMHEGNTAQFFVSPKHLCGKDIIKSFARAELPWAVRKRLKSQPNENDFAMVRSAFIDAIAPETLLSYVIDTYGIKINIVNSYSEIVQNYGCHFSYMELHGNSKQIELTIEYLNQNRLYTEVLGYVA